MRFAGCSYLKTQCKLFLPENTAKSPHFAKKQVCSKFYLHFSYYFHIEGIKNAFVHFIQKYGVNFYIYSSPPFIPGD